MARWPTLGIALTLIAVLVTSMVGPAVLQSLTSPAASASLDGIPAFDLAPPAAQAYGVYVSGTTDASPPLFGPSPFAEVSSEWGRSEELASAAEVFVRSADGADVLAHVRLVKGVTVANDHATYNPEMKKWQHWSTKARAHMYVASAELFNGLIKATALNAHVSASANVRNDSVPLKLSAAESRVADITVGATTFKGQPMRLDLPGVGTLWINQTLVDEAKGTVTNYALRLQMTSGMDIIVGAATAKVTRSPSKELMNCLTWSEAYPVGDKARVSAELADARHNHVMGDATQQGRASGYIDDVPVEFASNVLSVDAAEAQHDTQVTLNYANTETGAELLKVNLLNGLLEADLLRVAARATIVVDNSTAKAHALETSAAGTVLVGLRIANQPVASTVDVKPNTEHNVTIENTVVARVILNEQTATTSNVGGVLLASLRVNAVRVVVTGHGLGVPVGTQLVLGHAISIATCAEQGMPPMPPMDFGNPLGVRA